MKRYAKNLLFIVLSLVSAYAFGQTKKELEQKRKEKEEEIRFTKNLIQETSKKQKQTLNHLKVLNRQIESREELISTLNQEIQSLRASIQTNQEVVSSLEEDLKVLKEEYEKMVEFSYKTRSRYHKLVFIFSAESFNKAYKRLRFLRYYSDFRKRQIEMIRKTRASLEDKLKKLEKQRSKKRSLLAKEQKAKKELEADLEEKSEIVQNLNNKEEELKEKLAKKKKRAKELEAAIERLIEKEMKAKESESGSEYAKTPEAKIVSDKFEKNKANLPWPVEEGFISSGFGKQPHPTLSGNYIINNGIHITTSNDAKAKAVFQGEVRRIVKQRDGGLALIIRHGKYFTVYSNLRETKVEPGEQVKTNDVVGLVKTNGGTGKAELHFQIWHSYEKLNPTKWLAQK